MILDQSLDHLTDCAVVQKQNQEQFDNDYQRSTGKRWVNEEALETFNDVARVVYP